MWNSFASARNGRAIVGLAIDPAGLAYLGFDDSTSVGVWNFWRQAQVGVLGPDWEATFEVPDTGFPGQPFRVRVEVVPIADPPIQSANATLSLALEPVVAPGEPDAPFVNALSTGLFKQEPLWDSRRPDLAPRGRLIWSSTGVIGRIELNLTVPSDLSPGLWYLVVRTIAANGGRSDVGRCDIVLRHTEPSASITLHVPRHRSVFQQGERVESAVIIRSATSLPTGELALRLAARQSETLDSAAPATMLFQMQVVTGSNQTVLLECDTLGIHGGKYILQAEYLAGNQTLRDSYPLTVD